MFDFDKAREQAEAVIERAKLYLPAFCHDDAMRVLKISRALDDIHSDESVAALAMMCALYDTEHTKDKERADG